MHHIHDTSKAVSVTLTGMCFDKALQKVICFANMEETFSDTCHIPIAETRRHILSIQVASTINELDMKHEIVSKQHDTWNNTPRVGSSEQRLSPSLTSCLRPVDYLLLLWISPQCWQSLISVKFPLSLEFSPYQHNMQRMTLHYLNRANISFQKFMPTHSVQLWLTDNTAHIGA